MGRHLDKRTLEERHLVRRILLLVFFFLSTTPFRTDAKPVTIIALGCFHPVTKVQSASVHFFLGSDEDKADSDEDEDEVCMVYDIHYLRF